ncbi:MAG: transglycosylase domain-containing protein [Anaerorhabdus sp.]
MTQKNKGKQVKSRKKRKLNKRNLFAATIGIIVSCMVIVGIIGLFILTSILSDAPEFNINHYNTKESSQIFDQNGELVADVGQQIRTNVSYDDLPTSLIDAFVAIEDSRFFKHSGFDIPRFSKAMVENLKSLSFSQGGSTLTMQLTKMTYFMDDDGGIGATKSIDRKVQEIALALELEKNTSKQSIFEHYVNKINYGGSGNIRGIQKASQYYFNKDVTELNLAESAMLAGVVNSPYSYDPFRFLDYATQRRNTVLNMMLRHGYITKSEATIAKSIKVEDLLVDPYSNTASSLNSGIDYSYQSYVDTVIKEVQSLTGLDPTSVPMKIYTYMDKNIQATMDTIQSDDYEGVSFPDELMEVGMVTIDNQTGRIVAVGGGRNYGRGGSLLLNHATNQFKQPGSSVKPILDYALAFEYLGWATSHVVTDRPIVYRGTNILIKNFSGKYYGQVTLKYAIGASLNIPAIEALQEVIDTVDNGREVVVKYLQSLGFSQVTSDNFDLGFAIGGSNFHVSVLELAAANTALANGGYYTKPHTISRIEFNDGSAPLEPTYERKQVLSEESAYLTAQLMYEAVNGPYFNYMQLLKRNYPVYGKTGTSDWGKSGLQFNIPQGAAKDKWMISQTSKYTNAVWVGYEKGVKDAGTYFNAAKNRMNIPGKISTALLSVGNDNEKPAAITRPDGITTISHILGTWPYAYPIEGMDEKYLTTGEIKKENADKLVAPETANIEQISSFKLEYNDGNNVQLKWSPYPNQDQLSVAPDLIDLSLDIDGRYVEYFGPRIFDYTWIFGPIRYKAKVYVNDELINEITTDKDSYTQEVQLDSGQQTIKVCGYYGYEWLGDTSNEICDSVQVNIPEKEPDLSTEEGCLDAGMYWYDKGCHEEEKPEPTPVPTTTPEPTLTPTIPPEESTKPTE